MTISGILRTLSTQRGHSLQRLRTSNPSFTSKALADALPLKSHLVCDGRPRPSLPRLRTMPKAFPIDRIRRLQYLAGMRSPDKR